MLSWIKWMISGNHFKPQETELHSVFLRHFYVSPYWTDWPFMFPASLPVLPHGQLLTRPCASNWYVNRTSFDIFPWYEFRRFMALTACQCPSPWRVNVQFLPISSVFFACSNRVFVLLSRRLSPLLRPSFPLVPSIPRLFNRRHPLHSPSPPWGCRL